MYDKAYFIFSLVLVDYFCPYYLCFFNSNIMFIPDFDVILVQFLCYSVQNQSHG